MISKFLLLILISLIIIYYYIRNLFNMFKNLNIDGPKPIHIFGNLKDIIFKKMPPLEFLQNIYNKYESAPFVGAYFSYIPFLIIRDPEVLKEIFIAKFSNFEDRGSDVRDDVDPLSENLINMTSKKWRFMRPKLSPVFTSNKLKDMFYLISLCTKNYIAYIDNLTYKDQIFDCYKLNGKYTLDVISVCAFDLNIGLYSNDNNEIERIIKDTFATSFKNLIRRITRFLPVRLTILGLKIIQTKKINFFKNIMQNTITHRKNNRIKKNDFVDLLINLQNSLKNDEEKDITITTLTAQAYSFFTAGYKTSTDTMTYILYELASNPDIQNMLRQEICGIVLKNDEISYENLMNMKYLDKVLKETLRKYPPISITGRRSTNSHTFSDTNITIPKGLRTLIPIHALHHDPNYFPNPEKFDPERFDEENEKTRNPMTYLPFGHGPRRCIGERFAIITIKLAIANMIKYYNFKTCSKTQASYMEHSGSLLLTPQEGIYLKIERIEN